VRDDVTWHPAIGDVRGQLPRVGLIAALLVAAMTLAALGPTRPELPSERWTHLAGREVMSADLVYRLGMALEEYNSTLPIDLADRGRELIEGAVGSYEYYALSEIYTPGDTPEGLATQLAHLAGRSGWLMDIALADGYERVGDDAAAAAVVARQAERSLRFGAGCAMLATVAGALGIAGIVVILWTLIRRGTTLPQPRARLPFLVPWTLIDVAEIVAVLVFAMVLSGEVSVVLWTNWLKDVSGPLGQPLLLTVQYLAVAVVCLTLVWRRVGARSRSPLRSLGLRGKSAWRLIATGVGGYAVFLGGLVLAAMALRGLLGDAIRLGQTGDSLMESVDSKGELVIYFVLACVLAPIFEEIVFRGYVYAGLRRLANPRQAMLMGGLIFAAVHMNSEALVIIALIGVMLCYLYEHTRSLLPGMIAHGLHNALVLWVVTLQSM
jgi:membrane protease YdiL (CAAX protease family)